MNYKNAVIYWLHLPEHLDPSTEGYIGVSKNFETRMKNHLNDIINNKHKNPHLVNAVNKHGWDNIIKDILLSGEEAYCYEIVETMRTRKAIGWNIAPGGHRGPGWTKGRKKSKESIEKQVTTSLEKNTEKRLARIEARKILLKNREEKRQQKELEKKERTEKFQLRKRLCAEKREQQLAKREARKLKKIQDGTFGVVLPKDNRPICKTCNKNPCDINYHRNGKTYYRSSCDECGRKKKKLKPRIPSWQKSNYKKKPACDVCGFKSVLPTQIVVYYIDGDLENINLSNLRSICLNCVEVVKKNNVNWKRGGLQVDY
jgi:group I intron endonuclease